MLACIIVERVVPVLFSGQAIDVVLGSANKWIYGRRRMQRLSSVFILSHN